MSWLRSIFGNKPQQEAGTPKSAGREYKGFMLAAAPIKEGGQFRLAGVITKEIDGAMREHRFVRADVFSSKDEAEEFALRKAELIVDQSGDKIFD